MYPSLIGLYAPAMQSGKSEVAYALRADHGYTLVKFAGPLKDMARALFEGMGCDQHTAYQMVEGHLKEKVIPGFDTVTPRQIMQTLGTEWGREAIQNDLWIEVARKRAEAIIRNGGRVVIDDMRFANEYGFVAGWYGGQVWRVDRPGAVAYRDHPSEGLLEFHYFDVSINNCGTLADLRSVVASVLKNR